MAWTQDEWRTVEDRPSWISRLMSPRLVAGAQPRVPLTLVGLGGVAFVLSLVLGWQIVKVSPPPRNDEGSGTVDATQTLTTGLGSIETLSLVYLIGTVVLLALAAGYVNRPEVALRQRWAVAGGVLGILGILISVTVRLPDSAWLLERSSGVYISDYSTISAQLDISYGPGLFAGYFAVLLPAAAIWLSGRSVLVRPDPVEPAEPEHAEPSSPNGAVASHQEQWRPYRPAAQSGPLDLTVTPD